MTQVRLLVTAFGAFPGARANPTVAIARTLSRQGPRRFARLGIELVTEVLPVTYAEAPDRLAALTRRARPDAVLHLGLAGRRRTLSVETRAQNAVSSLRTDAERRLPSSRTIVEGGAATLTARWPAARLRHAASRHAPTQLSIDAGGYVCNHTLYLTLHSTRIPVGFLHVPYPDAGRLSLFRMVRAVESAIIVLAREARLSRLDRRR